MTTIIFVLILIFSIIIHEVSHGYAAAFQGDLTAKYQGRLTLNPLSHIDPIGSVIVPIITSLAGFPFGWAKPVPFNPYNLRNQRWGEIIVAIAGPVSNILIALVFGLIIRFMPGLSPSFLGLALMVIEINLSLALFNMLPVPPLDGSKVLFGLLPYHWSEIRWKLERYSLVLVFIIIMIPQISQFLSLGVIYGMHFISGLSFSEIVSYLAQVQ